MAGPADCAAAGPGMTKMPEPMIAPIPMHNNCQRPSTGRNPVPSRSGGRCPAGTESLNSFWRQSSWMQGPLLSDEPVDILREQVERHRALAHGDGMEGTNIEAAPEGRLGLVS
jgi:hypothetical protein